LDELLHKSMVERHKEWNHTYVGGKYIEIYDKNSNVQYWRFYFNFILLDTKQEQDYQVIIYFKIKRQRFSC
jgi:hypothetical protein